MSPADPRQPQEPGQDETVSDILNAIQELVEAAVADEVMEAALRRVLAERRWALE